MAFTTFSVTYNLPQNRLQLSFTLLLTAVTFKWVVVRCLPTISYLTTLTDEDTDLSNIKDNGNTIYYDSSNSTNSWLNGKTITLSDGGTLKPIQ